MLPQHALHYSLLRAHDDTVERNYGEVLSPPDYSRIAIVVVVLFCALQLRYSPPVDDIASTRTSPAEFPSLLLLLHVHVVLALANLKTCVRVQCSVHRNSQCLATVSYSTRSFWKEEDAG
jgi:hypothetical protein